MTEKPMDTKSSEKEIDNIDINAKQTEGSKSDIKDDLLSCDNCEYKCKKHVTLMKHMNSKHDNHICNIF